MQRYCTELTERLLKSLDREYNVVDMGAVVDVITALEKTTITKEVLEITRLGKFINELRRKTTNDLLAKRAKDLVRRWRDMVLPSTHATQQSTPADTTPQAINGTKPHSPALRGLKPQSPAIRSLKPHSPAIGKNLKPHSPMLRDASTYKVLSPALSLHSDQSRSPNPTPTKYQHHHNQQHTMPGSRPTSLTNNRLNSVSPPKIGLANSQDHSSLEAVPRTHSSNKRLRKDDSPTSTTSPKTCDYSRIEPSPAKRQRVNGETSSHAKLAKLTEANANNNVLVARGVVVNSTVKLNQQVPSPRDNERTIARLSELEVPREIVEIPGPKKRGRKKGSKSVKNQTLPEDRVKEKLASISRNPKLKTTQELLADLQARGSGSFATGKTTIETNASIPNRSTEPPSPDDILRNTGNDDRPLSSRFHRLSREKSSSLRSELTEDNQKSRTKSKKSRKSDDESQDDTSVATDCAIPRQLTVEEILAKLPPLDRDAIIWSDDDDGKHDDDDVQDVKSPKIVTDDDVDRLHETCIEGVNGNFQDIAEDTGSEKVDDIRVNDELSIAELKKKGVYRSLGGKENNRKFREWHEMLARPSYDGQTLHILPYVIVD